MGKVYLVGGGPGALDLYTIKALRCIQSCDCIIYDSLIDDQILKECKSDCVKLFAGKRAGAHYLSQEEINDLIVECANKYENVVRLKGGDVYVFGRGGEEGIRLYEEGIDFEVVPGISSAIAGLAYAGIPITHRGVSHGFQVITASTKKEEEEFNHYESLLDDDMTYVFLMGRAKLSTIVQRFKDAGKDINTPVALISKATMPTQQTVVGTLATIEEEFAGNPIPAPLLIVVGKVVSLRKALDFYERKPLLHQKLLITKVGEEDHTIKNLLNESGAIIDEAVTGKIEYLDNDLPDLKQYQGIVFTSRNGVIGFMKKLLLQYDIRELYGKSLIVVGDKTARVLQSYGLKADVVSRTQNSDALSQQLQSFNGNLVIIGPKGGQSIITKANDFYYEAYENKQEAINIAGHYDKVFFTCGSSVERLAATSVVFDQAISIGPKTTSIIKVCYPDCKIIEASKPDKELMAKIVLEE